jgi:hypothetical protein
LFTFGLQLSFCLFESKLELRPFLSEVFALLVSKLLDHLQIAILHHVSFVLVQLPHQGLNLEEGKLPHVHVLLVVPLQVLFQTFVVLLQKLNCAHLVLLSVDLLQLFDLSLFRLQLPLQSLFALPELVHKLLDTGAVLLFWGLRLPDELFEFPVSCVLLFHNCLGNKKSFAELIST